MGSKSHMTESERAAIARGISEGKSFREEIGKSQTTVSREIRKHLICEKKGCLGRTFNDCRKRFRCPADGCGDRGCRRASCASCSRWCGSSCPEYEKEECSRLSRPPYVCTGCRDMAKCTLEKRSYSPVIAQKEYRELLSSSREMIRCTDEEIKEMDRTISEGLAKGHSINHIYSYAGDAMPVSQRTAYEYINSGVFSESIRLSQPRAVRMKPRRKPVSEDTAGRDGESPYPRTRPEGRDSSAGHMQTSCCTEKPLQIHRSQNSTALRARREEMAGSCSQYSSGQPLFRSHSFSTGMIRLMSQSASEA